MKLALIRHQFAATGGAELYLHRLLTHLVAQGHEPHLFAESWDETQDGVTFHRWDEAYFRVRLATRGRLCVFATRATVRQRLLHFFEHP